MIKLLSLGSDMVSNIGGGGVAKHSPRDLGLEALSIDFLST